MRAALPCLLLLGALPAFAEPPPTPTPPAPEPARATEPRPAPTTGGTPAATSAPAPGKDAAKAPASETAKSASEEARKKAPDDAAGDPDGDAGRRSDDTVEAEAPAPVRPARDRANDSWKRPARIAGWIVLGAAGGLAAAGIATFGVQGYYASRWNDDTRCLVGGRFRFTTCGDDYNKATQMETLAIELVIAAGAVGVTATAVLLATRPSPTKKVRRPMACGPGPGTFGLACAGSF